MRTVRLRSLVLALAAVAAFVLPARAASVEELVSAVVRIKTYINPEGQTVQSLGREREGSGIVIDEDGLILTIGYLMVEAHAAEVTINEGRTVAAAIVGYDHETGFGILRTLQPLKIKPLAFGRSADVKRERSGAGRKRRRAEHGRRPRASRRNANSPAAGNTCSTRRSSPRRRIRPGAAPR